MAASSVVGLKVFVVSNCVENISFKFEGGWGVVGGWLEGGWVSE